MLEFQWPQLFWLLPLPLALWWLLPALARQEAALKVPFYNNLASFGHQQSNTGDSVNLKLLALSLIWLLLLTSSAGPRWLGDSVQLPAEGRDLMLAVDLSDSMQREDMEINGERYNRLVAVKAVVSDFVEQRQGDRLGLILFGSKAYIQAPLTFDRQSVKTLLQEAQFGFAGPSTAIGDAIGLAVKRLRERPAKSRVLILLTDGANTAGSLEPLKAAELAAQMGVKVYTIGFGADRMVERGFMGFGQRVVNPSQDLDIKTLEAISEKTGGVFFRARSVAELSEIYAELDRLEMIEQARETIRPEKSLFHWPLALALALFSVWVIGAQLWPSLSSLWLNRGKWGAKNG